MASGELFPAATPAPVTRAGWQCPGCLTHYAPDVRSCSCQARPSSLAERCTCPPAWGGIRPPPACPVHGQALMTRIIC